MVERELGAGPSELVVEPGGGPSAATDDGDPTWEDVEEEDEDLAASMMKLTMGRLSGRWKKRR